LTRLTGVAKGIGTALVVALVIVLALVTAKSGLDVSNRSPRDSTRTYSLS
jgi:hypothetical protein